MSAAPLLDNGLRQAYAWIVQEAIKELRDATVVMAHIEKRHSEVLKDLTEFRFRTEQNLAEITDKLNGLTGYVDGQRH